MSVIGSTHKPYLQIADANRNGKIDKGSETTNLLNQIDLDGNKQVSTEEKYFADAIANIAMKDKKNGLSANEKKEAQALRDKMLIVFDHNKDKKLSSDELKHYSAANLDMSGSDNVVDMNDLDFLISYGIKDGMLSSTNPNSTHFLGNVAYFKKGLISLGDTNQDKKLDSNEYIALTSTLDMDYDKKADAFEIRSALVSSQHDGKTGLSADEKDLHKKYIEEIRKLAGVANTPGAYNTNQQKISDLLMIADIDNDGLVSSLEKSTYDHNSELNAQISKVFGSFGNMNKNVNYNQMSEIIKLLGLEHASILDTNKDNLISIEELCLALTCTYMTTPLVPGAIPEASTLEFSEYEMEAFTEFTAYRQAKSASGARSLGTAPTAEELKKEYIEFLKSYKPSATPSDPVGND